METKEETTVEYVEKMKKIHRRNLKSKNSSERVYAKHKLQQIEVSTNNNNGIITSSFFFKQNIYWIRMLN